MRKHSGNMIRQCLKCGDYAADTEYRGCDVGEEHLRRTCCNCGYEWREECVDVSPQVYDSNIQVEVVLDGITMHMWAIPSNFTGFHTIHIETPQIRS